MCILLQESCPWSVSLHLLIFFLSCSKRRRADGGSSRNGWRTGESWGGIRCLAWLVLAVSENTEGLDSAGLDIFTPKTGHPSSRTCPCPLKGSGDKIRQVTVSEGKFYHRVSSTLRKYLELNIPDPASKTSESEVCLYFLLLEIRRNYGTGFWPIILNKNISSGKLMKHFYTAGPIHPFTQYSYTYGTGCF